MRCFVVIAIVVLLAPAASGQHAMQKFLQRHCLDCHSSSDAEKDIDLEHPPMDWSLAGTGRLWEQVLGVVEDGRMPPPDVEPPSDDERHRAAKQMHAMLTKNVKTGGTALRRLNREEYENTVSSVLGVNFKASDAFPADQFSHGFDNNADALILSPPLLEQYFEAATQAADMVLPPVASVNKPQTRTFDLAPDDFTYFFTYARVVDDVMRVVSTATPLARCGIWPSRFESRVSARYKVTINASAFGPISDRPHHLIVYARTLQASAYTKVNELRVLQEMWLKDASVKSQTFEADLYEGETIAIRYANSPLMSDREDAEELRALLVQKFIDDPKLHAAWLQVGFTNRNRGQYYWDAIQAAMASPTLDLSSAKIDSTATEKLLQGLVRNPVNSVETVCCQHFLTGPGIDIHRVKIVGPLKSVDGPKEIKQKQATARFLGERDGKNDEEYACTILDRFLSKAFRRPVDADKLEKYRSLAMRHIEDGHRFEDGIHLAIRAALCSTDFLYRGPRSGTLDTYDLAQRLSYFLASGPPNPRLQRWAESSGLLTNRGLKGATEMMLDSGSVQNFVRSFTGQWLGTRKLFDIMPDTRLANYNDKDRSAMIEETEMFFTEILEKNLPIQTFIDPDFTFANDRLIKNFYRLKGIKAKSTMQRINLDRGGRWGGILGQATVMMSTANGVDTQPVLRGVWLLENVFGQSPPPPPSGVPAIEPDTSGATTIRELLAKHRADPSCSGCHKRIDPLGFALESFDPIGRWRDHYPVYIKQEDGGYKSTKGPAVDTTGVLPDGTQLRDVTDLKKYLVDNIDLFSSCLTGKLLSYATGRHPTYADRQEISEIVNDVKAKGNGFRDLIVAVVQSEAFRTK